MCCSLTELLKVVPHPAISVEYFLCGPGIGRIRSERIVDAEDGYTQRVGPRFEVCGRVGRRSLRDESAAVHVEQDAARLGNHGARTTGTETTTDISYNIINQSHKRLLITVHEC